jgi:hypothetical protein
MRLVSATADSDNVPQPKYFHCPEETCSASFDRCGNLLRHVLIGKHVHVPNRVTLRDHALQLYSNRIEDVERSRLIPIVGDAISSLRESTNDEAETVEEGWANKDKTTGKRFSNGVQLFLRNCFDRGIQTGKKMDAREVVKLMKTSTINGKPTFTPDEILNSRQVTSAFSRLAKARLQLHVIYS